MEGPLIVLVTLGAAFLVGSLALYARNCSTDPVGRPTPRQRSW
jgi:hypothetical protein